jgi:hypothetical protein
MQSRRRWIVVLAITGIVALLGVPAFAAAKTTVKTVSTHIDQATLDTDWSTNGRHLQINAGNIVTVSPEGVTNFESVVGAAIMDISCSADSCQASAFAECVPAGREQYGNTLPPGALRFGPSPTEATLKTTFTCTYSFIGGEFPLVVDLAWSSKARLWGNGWLNSLWSATITGTAWGGTTDYNNPSNIGVIVHSTY